MMIESSDQNSTNVWDHSKPEWVMEQIQDLMKNSPDLSKRNAIFLKDKLSAKKKVKSDFISYSKTSNLYDVNFSTLTLNELESSSNLNLVMLGFVSAITESLLEIKELKKFIKSNSYIRERNKKKNLSALDLGIKLAKNIH
jgi:Pyruvate/2-oxoacid:ferredoxin oxidoreductase gamma subunit